ncbi:Transcriptional adapter 2-beta [Homalodisca vitripennis]|nr:Transcriptional adapter 2-beta [Homalodisca vitripennis]
MDSSIFNSPVAKYLPLCASGRWRQCFSAGAEIGTHRKDHPYQFIDSVALDIFSSGWSAREELQLLNAIEHYSYGNWKDISQHIGTKTPEEARDEYVGRFLSGEIGRLTWVAGLRSRSKLTDLTVGLEDDPQAMQVLPPLAPASKQPVADVRPEHAQQLDYMPLRDEFEVEYDNEAEFLVSTLTFSPDDDELDVALKVAQVEMYTQRLRERAKRHKVVKDNQLIPQYFNSGKDKSKKKMSREEKELGEKLRPLWKKQEQSIMVGVMKQRRLSRKLTELTRYRRNGLCRKEEIQHFDQERQIRQIVKPKSGGSSVQNFPVSQKKKEKSENSKPGSSSSSVSESGETSTESMASAHLLSSTESQLCSAMEITPTQYISMKALMLVVSVL